MEQDKSNDKIDMLLGKKENPALSKVLGKKNFDENKVLSKNQDSALSKMIGKEHTRSEYEKELTDKTVKCPKCGHEFVPEE
jgi:DNA-directed RNA polymerase subunit M/transcription elongation factor TFIIS